MNEKLNNAIANFVNLITGLIKFGIVLVIIFIILLMLG